MRHLVLTNTQLLYLGKFLQIPLILLESACVQVFMVYRMFWVITVAEEKYLCQFQTFFMLSIDIHSTSLLGCCWFCLGFFQVFGYAFAVDYLLALIFKCNGGDQSFVGPGTTFLSTLSITLNLVSHSQIFDVSALDLVDWEWSEIGIPSPHCFMF